MHEAVEDRRAHRVVAEVCAPVADDAVGGYDDATPELVAFVDDRLEQVACAVRDRPREEQIVQHEEIRVEGRAEQLLSCRRRPGHRVLGEELVGLDVQNAVTLEAGVVGDGLGDVALARAGLSDEQGVLAAGDELQGVQLEARLLWNLGIEAPVKLLQRRLLVEAGKDISALDQPRAPPIELVLQDQREGLQKGLIGGLGLQHTGLQRRSDSGEPELP